MLKRLFPDINWREWFTLDLRQVDWKRTALLVLLILAVASSLWQYAMPQYRVITENRFHPVPVIQRVNDVQRIRVACPESGIVTLDKQAVAKKLDIDFLQGGDIAKARAAETLDLDWIGADGSGLRGGPPPARTPADALQVTATADLPESDNGYEEVAIINTETGESQILAKEKESPWFQFRNDGAAGIRYGLCAKSDSPYCGTVYGRWDFLRLRDVYLSGNADLSTDGSAKLQIGAEYRWK